METLFAGYQQLAAAIRNLEPPAKGYARVFRGQTSHHDPMLPSGLRSSLGVEGSVFEMYSNGLAADIAHFSGKQQQIDDTELFLVWLQALAQHYGRGSRYLDVTKSLEVALWFALHQTQKVESRSIIGPRGPLDPRLDEISNLTWFQYVRAQAPGYLYVFHVPKWDGKGLPEHGMMVDLAEGPQIIAHSKRMEVQKGCTLYADKSVDAGDISKQYLAAPPFRVSWPMTGISLPTSADKLFPLPANDDWYARFIGAPLVNHADRKSGRLELRHPVAVNLYLPTRREDISDVDRRIIRIAPSLLLPALSSGRGTMTPMFLAGSGTDQLLEKATGIVLQSPLCALTPPIDDITLPWNHTLLAGDAAKSIAAYDLQTGQMEDRVSLTNVFLEFSPLEKTGWERVETGGSSIVWQRGLWLLRESQEFEIRACFQTFSGSDSDLAYSEPLLVSLDPSTKRFRYRTTKTSTWSDLSSGMPKVAKPFFVALMILRELTPMWKVTPFPLRVLNKDGERLNVGGLRRAAAKLARVRDARFGHSFYLLRDIVSGDVFARPTVATGHYLDKGESWAAVDASIVRERIANDVYRQSYKVGTEKGPEAAIDSYGDMVKEFKSVEEGSVRLAVANARYNKGAMLGQLQRYSEGIAEYDKIFADAQAIPDAGLEEVAARALLAKAISLGALGRAKEATEIYRKLLASFGNTRVPAVQDHLKAAREALS
jgi:FRG domain